MWIELNDNDRMLINLESVAMVLRNKASEENGQSNLIFYSDNGAQIGYAVYRDAVLRDSDHQRVKADLFCDAGPKLRTTERALGPASAFNLDPADSHHITGTHCAIDLERWNRCTRDGIAVMPDSDCRCYAGIFIGNNDEKTHAVVYVTCEDSGLFTIRPCIFVPQGAPPAWMRATVFGNVEAASLKMKKLQCAYDPWTTAATAAELQKRGVKMIEMPMLSSRLAGAMHLLQWLIASGRLMCANVELMNQMMSQMIYRRYANGNIMPVAKDEGGDISGPMALIMALAAYLNDDQQ